MSREVKILLVGILVFLALRIPLIDPEDVGLNHGLTLTSIPVPTLTPIPTLTPAPPKGVKKPEFVSIELSKQGLIIKGEHFPALQKIAGKWNFGDWGDVCLRLHDTKGGWSNCLQNGVEWTSRLLFVPYGYLLVGCDRWDKGICLEKGSWWNSGCIRARFEGFDDKSGTYYPMTEWSSVFQLGEIECEITQGE